ncbi:hypothetical protein GCM10007916_34520 [Psychromonas marina]|uniref:Porin n=1 Tax=Psychromonas marina TaxID=88364 RepID=A0ABQ6E4R8_9GAMM|nr:hypothetical protein [Psychromonas marina]GLS92381.1 hypothetical protein GCM10007916_34520 [Psychromonas marina]
MKNNYYLVTIPFVFLISSNALATIELTDDLLFSAFGSTSITTTDNETPIYINREINDETCFDCDTTLGLQLDYQFLNNFTTSIQVVKRPQDNWSEPALEWLHLGYSFSQFDIKIGRLRTPTFLDSEYYYVGHAYTTARPSNEVYDSQLGVTSYDGLTLKWQGELTDDIALSVEPYASFFGEGKATKGPQKYIFDIHSMLGVKVELSSYDYRFYMNALRTEYDLELQLAVPRYTLHLKDQAINTYSFGGEYLWDQLTMRAEAYYAQDSHFDWYAQLSYRFNKLSPYANYGQMHSVGSGRENSSRAITAGLRYDFTPNISMNLEYQKAFTENYFPSTSGQFTETFAPGSDTDANIYTLMLNFIL